MYITNVYFTFNKLTYFNKFIKINKNRNEIIAKYLIIKFCN